MSQPTPRRSLDRKKRRIFFAVMLSLPVLTLATLYLGSIVARGGWSYYKFKIRQHSWSGQAWRADPALGYAHVSGFRGRQYLSPDVSQAIRIDERGFRIPEGGRPPGRTGPRILSLGGSFTFGVGVESEATYTDLVAEELGGTAYNAGVNGYGLSQMIVQSRQLLEPVKPDVVLASFASWIVHRAQDTYSSTRFAAVPVPYVAGVGLPVRIELPAVEPKIFDLHFAERLDRPVGAVGLLDYLVRVAFPLYLHDDANRLAFGVRRATGRAPEPLGDPVALVRAGYSEILANATAAGARLYVVDITSFYEAPDEYLAALRAIPGLRFVETRDALWSHVEGTTPDDYLRRFGHWVDGAMVDLHPNAAAHRILAEETRKVVAAELP